MRPTGEKKIDSVTREGGEILGHDWPIEQDRHESVLAERFTDSNKDLLNQREENPGPY